MANLKLQVATPDGLALDTEAEIVTAPSVAGEFGVLTGHLPLLAAIKGGVLRYRVGGQEKIAAVGPGFVEAQPDHVLVLTDEFATPESIDREAAKSELSAAEKAIADYKGPIEGGQHEELQRQLDWARARVEASAAR